MTKIGTIYEENAMFLRTEVGEAKDKETGITYELTTHAGNGSPIISSDKTRKKYSLSWQEIINLAIENGIND